MMKKTRFKKSRDTVPLKGRSREMFNSLFSPKSSFRPLFHALKCFAYNFDFALIFEFEADLASSMKPTTKSELLLELTPNSSAWVQRPWQFRSPVIGLGLIMSSKK
jgi:hypothetical protein